MVSKVVSETSTQDSQSTSKISGWFVGSLAVLASLSTIIAFVYSDSATNFLQHMISVSGQIFTWSVEFLTSEISVPLFIL
ncbi:MAG: hypothetical protein AAFR67_11010, partial [Chloroflexota bacterium]